MPTPHELIACSLTYRDASDRTTPVADSFVDENAAIATFTEVLLHEARQRLLAPIDRPDDPYLHPVDVGTDQPGIVDRKDELHILRVAPGVPRVRYGRRPDGAESAASSEAVAEETRPPVDVPLEKARKKADEGLRRALAREEKKAETKVRNEEKREATRLERERETPDERRERIAETKRKREETMRKRQLEETKREKAPKKDEPDDRPARTRPKAARDVEELLITPDAAGLPPPHRPVRRKGKHEDSEFFESPVPDHRHLYGLQRSGLSTKIAAAVLHCFPDRAVEIVCGPPGTGKTHALIERVPTTGRVLLCAPTNVGAVNLYARCVTRFPDETALVMPPERVPAGVPVVSDDRRRRIVCATVSARGGRALDAEVFEAVFLDEAAQCMEAWAWTLLRPAVVRLCMAGDVRQLPSLVSESGRKLRHDRSLMGRLLHSGYPSTELTVQNRMAPQVLEIPNALFYDGRLTCGAHAPHEGAVEAALVVDGAETMVGHSYRNAAEADHVASLLASWSEAERAATVVLAPYAEQCRLILSKRTGVPVHTVDSFQGREADSVVLSVVRTGASGLGFWDDPRRVVVALTRARRRLVVVHSIRQAPPSWIG